MLLYRQSDFPIVRRLSESCDRAKEHRIRPAEIIQSRIIFFSIPDERRPEITVGKRMAQGVIHGRLRHFEQLLISGYKRTAQGTIGPITFLFPRPPRGIILFSS